MRNFIIRQCPKLGQYLLCVMTVYMVLAFTQTTVFAVDDMWSVANKIIVDVYNKVAGISTGLALWLYGLILSGVEYISNALLDVFQMDMTYFETAVPVSKDIFAIIVAVGWALLIGNLTFQA